MREITQASIKSVLHYNPETGKFTWIESSRGRRAGDEAGCTNCGGYRIIGIEGHLYYAHRLAFLYMTGRWPTNQVDHRDRNPSNNQWANLREATHGQNVINRFRKSKRGLPRGVLPHGKRYRACCISEGVRTFSKSFATPNEAHAAYLAMARRIHGEFLPD